MHAHATLYCILADVCCTETCRAPKELLRSPLRSSKGVIKVLIKILIKVLNKDHQSLQNSTLLTLKKDHHSLQNNALLILKLARPMVLVLARENVVRVKKFLGVFGFW